MAKIESKRGQVASHQAAFRQAFVDPPPARWLGRSIRSFAPRTSPIRSTPSNGTCAPPPSRASRAKCCSSRPTAKSRRSWSQLATNVVVSKYFYGEINTPRARDTAFGS